MPKRWAARAISGAAGHRARRAAYAAIAPVATVQVAASVIVTAVLTPMLTAWMFRKLQRERAVAINYEEVEVTE